MYPMVTVGEYTDLNKRVYYGEATHFCYHKVYM